MRRSLPCCGLATAWIFEENDRPPRMLERKDRHMKAVGDCGIEPRIEAFETPLYS